MGFSQRLTVVAATLALVIAGGVSALVLTGGDDGSGTQPAHAQARDETQGISVRGEGQIAVVPDTAKVMLGVEVEGEDIGALREDADARMSEVIETLEAAGIDEADIQTITYDITERDPDHRPPQPYEGETSDEAEAETPAIAPDEPVSDQAEPAEDSATEEADRHPGYKLTQMVQVTVRDIDATGDIIDQAVDAGANRVGHIYFEVDDRADAIAQARELAVEDARAKGQHLADLTNVSLGAPVHIEEHSPSAPPIRMGDMAQEEMAADGAGAAPIEPGESVITVNVHIVYGIE